MASDYGDELGYESYINKVEGGGTSFNVTSQTCFLLLVLVHVAATYHERYTSATSSFWSC